MIEDELQSFLKCQTILVQRISDTYLEHVKNKKRDEDVYDSPKLVFEKRMCQDNK